MKSTIIAACVFVTFLVAFPCFAQVPIGPTGNLLVGAVYNDGLTSSDMCLVVQLEANGDILVDEEHPVMYFHNQTPNNLAGVTDWMTFDYDDSGWLEGVNGVGYNAAEITSVPDTDDQGAIYMRFARFDIPNASLVTSMTIRVDYDDCFIIWLNEVEVVRSNMRTDGLPEWDHDGGGHESTNKPGPDPSRWNATVSNLITNQADDNPDGTIVVYTFDVAFSPSAAQPTGKLPTVWAAIKSAR